MHPSYSKVKPRAQTLKSGEYPVNVVKITATHGRHSRVVFFGCFVCLFILISLLLAFSSNYLRVSLTV